MVDNEYIRHDPDLVASSIIELICDDLKYQDKQNDPQYLMLNTKLREEKRINKIKKRMAKKEKKQLEGKAGKREKERKGKSKFSSKYSDRIESIREADEKARRKVQRDQVKRKRARTTSRNERILTQNRNKAKMSNLKEDKERITKPKSARGRKKTPEEIRKEMLKKLNETK